jgi:hypothetical protein
LRRDDAIPPRTLFLRAAFVRESGEALIRKHAGKDPLFTPEGYREYAEDLFSVRLTRFFMTAWTGWAVTLGGSWDGMSA